MPDPSQYPQDPYGGQYPPSEQPTTRIDRQGQRGQAGQYQGGQLPPADQYSGYGGQPPGEQYSGYGGQPTPPSGRPTSVTAVVGLVLAFLVSPVGIIVSALGLRDTRGGRKAGRGLAIAGVIIGVLLTLLGIVAIVAAVALVRAATPTVSDIASQLESLPTEIPTDLFTDLPSDLPTDLATELPTDGGDYVDATEDAAVTDCYDDGDGTAYGEVTVTNSSDDAGSYIVNVYAYDEDGTKIGELGAVSDEVEPGDSATAQLGGYVDEGATIASCEVVQAVRE